MEAASTSTHPSPFDNFEAFATQIYNTPPPYTPYLWPALYGGETTPGHEYEVLFVFSAALSRLTLWRKKWPPNSECGSTIDAIWTHRCIFFQWVRSSPSTALFELFGRRRPIDWAGSSSSTNLFDLSREVSPITDFYKRFYITDVWKDHNPERKDYWRCTLRTELQCVPTQCVVFVGSAAKTNGPQRLKGRVPHYDVLFPIPLPKQDQPVSRSQADFKASFDKLRQQLIDDHRIPRG